MGEDLASSFQMRFTRKDRTEQLGSTTLGARKQQADPSGSKSLSPFGGKRRRADQSGSTSAVVGNEADQSGSTSTGQINQDPRADQSGSTSVGGGKRCRAEQSERTLMKYEATDEESAAMARMFPRSIALSRVPRQPIRDVIATVANYVELEQKVGARGKALIDFISDAFQLLGISDTKELGEQLISERHQDSWMITRKVLLESIKDAMLEESIPEDDSRKVLQACSPILARLLRRFSLQVNGFTEVSLAGALPDTAFTDQRNTAADPPQRRVLPCLAQNHPSAPSAGEGVADATPKMSACFQEFVDSIGAGTSSGSKAADPASIPRGQKRGHAAVQESAASPAEQRPCVRRRIRGKSPNPWTSRSSTPEVDGRAKRKRVSTPPAPAPGSPPAPAIDKSQPVGHYEMLQIPRNASSAEVRTAYRQRALKTHPDKGGNPDVFRLVVAAFEVLSDQVSRAIYDEGLEQRGSSDGRTVYASQTSSSSSAGVAEDGGRETREARGRARVALFRCTRQESSPSDWQAELADMGANALRALLDMIMEDMKRRGGRRSDMLDGEDEEKYPREIPAPPGLPPGWRAMAYKYKSGKSSGKVYTRFVSPWKAIAQTVGEAALFHYRKTGEDVSHLLSTKAPASPRVPGTPISRPVFHKESRGIYSSSRANGKAYYAQLGVAGLAMRTGWTTSLEEAIDWHVAITEFKTNVTSHCAAGTTAIMQKFLQLLQGEPSIQLTFWCQLQSSIPGRTFSTPTAEDFETALQYRQYFESLGDNWEAIEAAKQADVKNRETRKTERIQQLRLLKQAVVQELERRGDRRRCLTSRAALPAIQNVVDVTGDSTTLALPAPSSRSRPGRPKLRREASIVQVPNEPPALLQTGAATAQGSWIPGVESTPGVEVCLTLVELSRLRGACCCARLAADEEMRSRLRRFVLRPDDFQPKVRQSAGGRVIRQSNSDQTVCHRLVGFLTCRHHMKMFTSLDLTKAAVFALETPELQATFRKMPHLEEVIAPLHGWGSPGARNRFLNSIPKHVAFTGYGPNGAAYTRGPDGIRRDTALDRRRLSISGSESRLSMGSEARLSIASGPRLSIASEPRLSIAPEPRLSIAPITIASDARDRSNAVYARDLIANWDELDDARKKEMSAQLREAADSGLIPAKTGSFRWWWPADDPTLPSVRQVLASAGFQVIGEGQHTASNAEPFSA